jgi:hypothetical protein
VTFPRWLLVAAPVLAAGLAPAALAGQQDAAAKAVQILARARVTDARCHFLSSSAHEELAGYSARAETAAIGKLSASITRAAIAVGEAEGRKASCNDTARKDVGETLAAARQAVGAADSGPRQAAAEPATTPAPAPAPAEPPPAPLAAERVASGAMVGGLGYYAGQVKAYYVERKCMHLSARQDDRYWRAIGRIHTATVARNGASAVAPVMRRAEAQARQLACGSNSLRMVEAGYREVTRQ